MTPHLSMKLTDILAYRESPLCVAVTPKADPRHVRVSVHDRHVDIPDQSLEDVAAHIRRILAFYPASASVNGRNVETAEFPDVAHVIVTTWGDSDEHHRSATPVHARQLAGFNAYVAGVLCNTDVLPSAPSRTVWLRDRRTHYAYSLLSRMIITPMPVVTPEEYAELRHRENRLDTALSNNVRIKTAITNRTSAQITDTLDRMALDNIHDGPVHHLATPETIFHSLGNAERQLPIAVHGVPVFFDKPPSPANLSLLLNFTENPDTHIVPVLDPRECQRRLYWSDQTHKTVPDILFEHEVAGDDDHGNVTMIRASFIATGEYPHNPGFHTIPDKPMEKQHAAKIAARCFIDQASRQTAHISPPKVYQQAAVFYRTMDELAESAENGRTLHAYV